MLRESRLMRCVMLGVVLVGLCGAQASKKSRTINRAALGKHRDAISKSTSDVTKETVEDAQVQLDAAAKAFHEWLAEEDLKADDKMLAVIVRNIEKKQDELNQLRGSPPKRPEFEPFVGKWTSEHGTLSINEFGTGTFLWISKDAGNGKLATSFSKPIAVARDGKSFRNETITFSLGDDPEALDVEIKSANGLKPQNFESDFTLKRVSKTPDPEEVKTKSSKKKSK